MGFGCILRFEENSGNGVSYSYDGLGRVASATDMNSRTISYQYNQASARTRLTYPDANYIGYGLDALNRLSTTGWNANTGLLGAEIGSNIRYRVIKAIKAFMI